MKKGNEKVIRQLCEVLAGMQNVDDVAAFLDDLCTVSEIESLSLRLEVARCLDGGMNYAKVNETTGVSSATICRVNRCLNYGAGGYKTALKLIEKESAI